MELASEKEQQLRALVRFFLEENSQTNLSAYRDETSCWTGNVLDSIWAVNGEPAIAGAMASAIPNKHGGMNVLEVGIGGGFPLLPLAILFPQSRFTGFDATGKKVEAVKRIVKKLNLQNVTCMVGRAETLGHEPCMRERFDFVLARAVAPLRTLLEYMSPFVRKGGQLLCWKSMHIDRELQESVDARIALQCRLIKKITYELPGGWGKRQLLVFAKTGALPAQFPRGVGLPKKEPL